MGSKIFVWRAILGAVTVLVIITGGALVVTDQKTASTDSKQAGSNPQDPAATASSASPGESAPATEAAGGASASKPESGTVDAPARPFGAPAQGNYRFKVTTTMSGGEPSSKDFTVNVADVSSSESELRQRILFRNDEGQGERETSWRSAGMVVISESFSMRSEMVRCDWEPDMPELKAPLKVGQQWSYESSCTMQGQGTSANRHRKVAAQVMEIKTAQVAGQAVEVYVIKDNATETFTFGTSTNRVETETTAQFASKFGLNVRVTQKSKAAFGARTFESTSEFELQNLKPE